jgi:hypothetical protein
MVFWDYFHGNLSQNLSTYDYAISTLTISLSHLRKDDGLIQVQVGEVTQLLQQLQEKNEVSFSLSQHLKDLHTQENPDNQQDHGEQLAEACRVVESFVYMISAG